MSSAAAALSEPDRVGRACVQELLARCAARERASDSDWTTEANGLSIRKFPEGMLAKRKIDDVSDEWILWWCTSKVIRPLNRGPLADIECDTREVILFGPPGGPDDGSGPRVWCPDEGSLFATAIHGSFRLMVRPDGRGTLIFARDDFSTLYLGDDSIDELRRTADRRLREHRGDPIRGWIGGRRFDFHGVGVGGVVGQVELMRDTWLVLVRAGDDRFDLYMVVGGQILDRVGSYSESAVTGGDLGQLFDRHDVEAVEANDPVPPSGGRRPGRTPPHHTGAPPPRTTRAKPTRPATLSADQLGRIDTAFSRTGPFGGKGASYMGALYAALRVLNTCNLPDMRIKTKEFHTLVKQQGKQHIGDKLKTFTRAAERVLEDAKFGKRDGHWWELPFAAVRHLGPVFDRICEHFEPTITPPAATEPTTSTPSPPAATEPTTATPAPPTATEPTTSTPAPPAATEPTTSAPAPPAGPSVSSTAAPAAPEPTTSTPAAPAGPPVSSTATPAATVPASSTPSAEPSASPSAPSAPASSASSTGAVRSASSSSTQASVPCTPAVLPTSSQPATPIQSSPATPLASSIPAAVSPISVQTDLPPAPAAPPPAEEMSGGTSSTGPLIHPSCAPVPPVESGPPPVGADPPLEADPPEVEVDQAPDETVEDEHWHPVVRKDGKPTFYEPSREQSDDAPSRFKGAKIRGPP